MSIDFWKKKIRALPAMASIGHSLDNQGIVLKQMNRSLLADEFSLLHILKQDQSQKIVDPLVLWWRLRNLHLILEVELD